MFCKISCLKVHLLSAHCVVQVLNSVKIKELTVNVFSTFTFDFEMSCKEVTINSKHYPRIIRQVLFIVLHRRKQITLCYSGFTELFYNKLSFILM